jgi:hypothetical protein
MLECLVGGFITLIDLQPQTLFGVSNFDRLLQIRRNY